MKVYESGTGDGLYIEAISLGMIGTNCYIVVSNATKTAVVTDPAEAEPVIRYIKAYGLSLKAIVLTHGHADHISGVAELKAACRCPVYLNEEDTDMAEDSSLNFAESLGLTGLTLVPDETFKDGDVLGFDDIELKVMHTPGHTKGSSCFMIEGHDVLLSGDTMFCGSYGRTDLYGGSDARMEESLLKLCSLDDAMLVLPGHGRTTTIGEEKYRYVRNIY